MVLWCGDAEMLDDALIGEYNLQNGVSVSTAHLFAAADGDDHPQPPPPPPPPSGDSHKDVSPFPVIPYHQIYNVFRRKMRRTCWSRRRRRPRRDC